jgi:hypothetical protein
MKKSLFLMMIAVAAIAFAGCGEDESTNDDVVTPPYAASTMTWVFGSQTWSDAIHIPECGSPSFESSSTVPQCRSYTSGTNTRYYYNWAYVNTYVSKLCPSPWRVPTYEDFEMLVNNIDYSTLVASWGYGGVAYSSIMDYVSLYAYYWSSSQLDTDSAYRLDYTDHSLGVDNASKRCGFQVRCVK